MLPDELLKYWPIISTALIALGGAFKWVVSILRELDEQKAETRVWKSVAENMLPTLRKAERLAKDATVEVLSPPPEVKP